MHVPGSHWEPCPASLERIPMRARVVRCLLQLATVDLTVRRYDAAGRRSDEHRGCEEACAQRSTEAARLSSEDDNPAA